MNVLQMLKSTNHFSQADTWWLGFESRRSAILRRTEIIKKAKKTLSGIEINIEEI